MEYIKPDVIEKDILNLINNLFLESTNSIEPVSTGQIANTYRFTNNGVGYYINFINDNMAHVIRNELFLKDRLVSNSIPIRNIVKIGTLNDIKYMISEKVEGQPIHLIESDLHDLFLTSVMDVLYKIANVDINDTSGYGWFNNECNGSFGTWAEQLLQIKDEDPNDFYGEWHNLFQSSFLDKTIFYAYYRKMESLIKNIPNIRNLVHGGFAGGNVLISGNHVSAVIDWSDSRYGDNVFDIAYILFWYPEDLAKKYEKAFCLMSSENGICMDNIEDRIKCYKYYIGLDSLRFFAKKKDKSSYDFTLKVLSAIK